MSENETWLGVGEKYALLGLNIKSDQAGFVGEQLSADLSVLTGSAFKMPVLWRRRPKCPLRKTRPTMPMPMSRSRIRVRTAAAV